MSNEIDLIRKIVIGKRYLWKPQVSEIVCSKCGYVYAPTSEDIGKEFEVTIVLAHSDTEHPVVLVCVDCKNDMYHGGDGWYRCRLNDGDMLGVPYTQLTEIEGEDYD